jgi:uncharacterized protein (TIGR03435 family)
MFLPTWYARRMNLLGIAAACSCTFLTCHGVEPNLSIGDAPPPLALEGLLQVPAQTSGAAALEWPMLRGKVVVLEFWATWCGPCIAAMPHLNELADQFKDEPVHFIAITDEDEQTVQRFLEKGTIQSWIGLDSDRSLFRAMGIRSIPRTVVVGKDGRIAGMTSPRGLDAAALRSVLAGDRLPAVHTRTTKAGVDPAGGAGPAPLFQVVIRPSVEKISVVSIGSGKMTAEGMTVQALIRTAWPEWASGRIIFPEDLETDRYTMIASMPPGREEQLQPTLRQTLARVFGLSAREEHREVEVAILTLPRGKGPGLKPAALAQSSAGLGHFTAADRPWSEIAGWIGGALGMVIVDQTGIEGNYNTDLHWDPEQKDGYLRALLDATGVEIKSDRQYMEVLVIERE